MDEFAKPGRWAGGLCVFVGWAKMKNLTSINMRKYKKMYLVLVLQ